MFGVGEKKTPVSFRNACDDFIFTENLGAEPVANSDTPKTDNAISTNGAEELIPALLKAWGLYQNDDGWVNAGSAGSFLKRAKPDFDPRTYGLAKFTGVVAGLSSIFEMTKQKDKGTTQMILYRPKIATP